MKRLYRIFITTLLIVSISITSITVFASEDSSDKVEISGLNLVLLKENLAKDPMIQEVTLIGNTLEFSTTDGTVASISIQQANGIETTTVIENGNKDIITADLNTSDVFLNGEEVIMSVENTDEVPEILPFTDWTFIGLSYPFVEAEIAIRDVEISVLIALVAYSTGNYSFMYEAAYTVINRLIALASTTKKLYVRRMTFRDPTWTIMKYNDNYFANGNYDDAGWLYVVEHEFAGGGR